MKLAGPCRLSFGLRCGALPRPWRPNHSTAGTTVYPTDRSWLADGPPRQLRLPQRKRTRWVAFSPTASAVAGWTRSGAHSRLSEPAVSDLASAVHPSPSNGAPIGVSRTIRAAVWLVPLKSGDMRCKSARTGCCAAHQCVPQQSTPLQSRRRSPCAADPRLGETRPCPSRPAHVRQGSVVDAALHDDQLVDLLARDGADQGP